MQFDDPTSKGFCILRSSKLGSVLKSGSRRWEGAYAQTAKVLGGRFFIYSPLKYNTAKINFSYDTIDFPCTMLILLGPQTDEIKV